MNLLYLIRVFTFVLLSIQALKANNYVTSSISINERSLLNFVELSSLYIGTYKNKIWKYIYSDTKTRERATERVSTQQYLVRLEKTLDLWCAYTFFELFPFDFMFFHCSWFKNLVICAKYVQITLHIFISHLTLPCATFNASQKPGFHRLNLPLILLGVFPTFLTILIQSCHFIQPTLYILPSYITKRFVGYVWNVYVLFLRNCLVQDCDHKLSIQTDKLLSSSSLLTS